MLSVVIFISGSPIMARSAVNTGKSNSDGQTIYDVDDGTCIYHNEDDGAVALAIQLLETIKEQGVSKRRRRQTARPLLTEDECRQLAAEFPARRVQFKAEMDEAVKQFKSTIDKAAGRKGTKS